MVIYRQLVPTRGSHLLGTQVAVRHVYRIVAVDIGGGNAWIKGVHGPVPQRTLTGSDQRIIVVVDGHALDAGIDFYPCNRWP